MQEKSPTSIYIYALGGTWTHEVFIELDIGARTTYQATGDAGYTTLSPTSTTHRPTNRSVSVLITHHTGRWCQFYYYCVDVLSILDILIIINFPCHPTMNAWSSTLITHNLPERRKPRKQKGFPSMAWGWNVDRCGVGSVAYRYIVLRGAIVNRTKYC